MFVDENENRDNLQNTNQAAPPTPEPAATPETTPGMMRSTLPGASVDPPTYASNEEQQLASLSPQSAVEPHTQPVGTSASPAAPKQADNKRRMLIIAGGVVLLLLAGVATWWLLAGNKTDDTKTVESSQPVTTEQPKLGIAITVADGMVEYLLNDAVWQPIATDTELKEGVSVRTGNESRAVFTLDDGSAVRLDADTTIEFKSLAANDVKITQVAGTVYSRVVTSERKYAVTIDDSTYEAQGTAFATMKNTSESGVQVYQSSVKASDSAEAVSEGKQYYTMNGDAALQGKVTNLDVAKLADSTFIAWNLIQDEMDTKFKDKLGILSQIKQQSEEKLRQAATEYTLQLQREEAKKKEKEHSSHKEKVTRGTMSLTLGDGNSLKWSYSGKAVHGYKLVYSLENKEPVFEKDDAIYISDQNTMSISLPKEITPDQNVYNFRVCAYTAGSEDEPCVDYSNPITVSVK